MRQLTFFQSTCRAAVKVEPGSVPLMRQDLVPKAGSWRELSPHYAHLREKGGTSSRSIAVVFKKESL